LTGFAGFAAALAAGFAAARVAGFAAARVAGFAAALVAGFAAAFEAVAVLVAGLFAAGLRDVVMLYSYPKCRFRNLLLRHYSQGKQIFHTVND
jgi:hypothetical protein